MWGKYCLKAKYAVADGVMMEFHQVFPTHHIGTCSHWITQHPNISGTARPHDLLNHVGSTMGPQTFGPTGQVADICWC